MRKNGCPGATNTGTPLNEWFRASVPPGTEKGINMNDNPDTNTSSDTNEPPKPKLMLDHTPGFVHEEHTDQGDIVLFRSTQPDFGLGFQADISWFTEGDPQTALSFYMEPSGSSYWQFTDPDQPSDLANHCGELERWLDDIGAVCEYLQRRYPELPVLEC